MFYINTENVHSAIQTFTSGEQALMRKSHEVNDVSSSLADLSGMDEVIAALQSLSNSIGQEAGRLGDMYDAVERIIRLYRGAEDTIVDNQRGPDQGSGFGVSTPDFTDQSGGFTGSKKIDYGTLDELSGLFT